MNKLNSKISSNLKNNQKVVKIAKKRVLFTINHGDATNESSIKNKQRKIAIKVKLKWSKKTMI